MRQFILLLILAIFAGNSAYACDVNLFAIISGVSKQDAFTEGMGKLAAAIKNLGDHYTVADQAEKKLQELMSGWVAFSTSFSQYPPEWARKDEKWQEKFGELGNIIGEIRRQLSNDNEKAHISMLKFSRRLPQLYLSMPMSEQARSLLGFTQCFDHLWEAYYAKDLEKLRVSAKDLKNRCSLFATLVSAEQKKELDLLTSSAEQVRAMTTQINAFKTISLKMSLEAAESQFVSLNERISKSPGPAKSQ